MDVNVKNMKWMSMLTILRSKGEEKTQTSIINLDCTY